MITRRAFISTLAGGLLAAPVAAEAQQAEKVYRVGYMGATTPQPADALPFSSSWKIG